MKRFTKVLTVIILTILTVYCAQGQNRKAMDKIKSAKIAMITDRLELTPEQAEKFWPLYNEYSVMRKELRAEYRSLRGNRSMDLTEEQSRALLEQRHQLRQRQLQIENNYQDKLSQVITSRQLLQLKTVEEDFRKLLLQRLQQRSDQIEQRQELMQQRLEKESED